jgi:hypothetical protein
MDVVAVGLEGELGDEMGAGEVGRGKGVLGDGGRHGGLLTGSFHHWSGVGCHWRGRQSSVIFRQ